MKVKMITKACAPADIPYVLTLSWLLASMPNTYSWI